MENLTHGWQDFDPPAPGSRAEERFPFDWKSNNMLDIDQSNVWDQREDAALSTYGMSCIIVPGLASDYLSTETISPENAWAAILADFGAASNDLDVTGSPAATATSMLILALSFLRRNPTVVEWSMVAAGQASAAAGLLDSIQNVRYHIIFEPDTDATYMDPTEAGHKIHVGPDFFLEKYLAPYLAAQVRGDLVTALLTIMDLSGTLLHEMVHLEGLCLIDNADGCFCSYLVENFFRWVCLYTYPELQLSCVTSYLHDRASALSIDVLYGYDSSIYLARGCFG